MNIKSIIKCQFNTNKALLQSEHHYDTLWLLYSIYGYIVDAPDKIYSIKKTDVFQKETDYLFKKKKNVRFMLEFMASSCFIN